MIAATGFQTPLRICRSSGSSTVADGRIPALTPFWESVSLPGVFFAGNASQGARGIGKRGAGASSTSVNGFRYNARVLARHLAERLDCQDASARAPVVDVVPFLLRRADERARALGAEGLPLPRRLGGRRLARGRGRRPARVVPRLGRPDAYAASVEVDEAGKIVPTLYVRRGGEIAEHQLEPHPLHQYEGEPYRRELTSVLAALGS